LTKLQCRPPPTAGHAHDGRQFESFYESLDPENVLESAIMDKGYDADRIRERLSYDGVQAVIPPIPTRAGKLPYDHARYRQRNRIERFLTNLNTSAALPPAMTNSQKPFSSRELRRSERFGF
jgi:transposase